MNLLHMDAPSNSTQIMDQFYSDGQDLGLSTPWPSYDISTLPIPHLLSVGNTPHLSGTAQANNDLANGQASRHSSPLPDQTTIADVGTRKRKAPTLRAIDWEPVKCRIIELHITRNISLPDVQEQIKKEFGFEATFVSLKTIQTKANLLKSATISESSDPMELGQECQEERDAIHCPEATREIGF